VKPLSIVVIRHRCLWPSADGTGNAINALDAQSGGPAITIVYISRPIVAELLPIAGMPAPKIDFPNRCNQGIESLIASRVNDLDAQGDAYLSRAIDIR